jgi:transposase
MLAVNATTRVYLYMRDVDMRRSFDGLMAIVQAEFERDIRLGDYFMFVNKRRDRLKIIWWDRDGLAIFMKRLEAGTVQKPLVGGNAKSLVIDQAQLAMLLTGIDVSNIHRRKRYQVHESTMTNLQSDASQKC